MASYITNDELRTALSEQTEQIASMFVRVYEQLDEHSHTLGEHSRILGEHSEILSEHSRILGEHSQILGEHTRRFDNIEGQLTAIDERLDRIDGRMESLENDIKEIYQIITHIQRDLKTQNYNQTELEARVDQLETLLHKIAKKTDVSLT